MSEMSLEEKLCKNLEDSCIKAYRKVGQEWEEIKFVCGADFKQKEMPQLSEPLFFSGEATLDFIDAVESLARTLLIKPKLEAWKASGKRKKPRIK